MSDELDTPKCDVVLGGDTQHIGQQIVETLANKGFVTIDPHLDEDELDIAFREVKRLERKGSFVTTPMEVAEGLLGSEGAYRCSDLPARGDAQDVDEFAPTVLHKCDQILSSIVDNIAPHAHILAPGFGVGKRSSGVVCEAGAGKAPPFLEETDVAKWLPVFETGRLMVLLFLGPGSGTLTLDPFDEELKPVQVRTLPGMAMILRADGLARRHVVPGRKGFVLACFVAEAGKSTSKHGNTLPPRIPSAMALESWNLNKLKELAGMELEEIESSLATTSRPEHWRFQYDHTFHSCQQTAVRGLGVKWPSTWSPEATFILTLPGADVVQEVPRGRWDVLDYYDPDPECWARGKVNVKHGGFGDGFHLFDARFFRIAPAEAKSMDPQQRIILDCGYEALHRAGRTAKNLLNSLTGVYVGVLVSEFSLIDTGPEEAGGCEQRAAGTGIAGAIMSNRFSFVFGMQGPSITIDTDASSSLTALQLGAASLFKGKVAATMSVAVGMSVMLSPLTWLGRVATKEMGGRGRCFSFDQCGEGWVRAEGNGSVAMDNLLELVDGQLVHDETKSSCGVISSVVVKNVGQAASLNTPSGPAQIVLFNEACRQAGIAPTSIDAVECHADGQLLHDAVEVESCRKCFGAGLQLRAVEGRVTVPLKSIKSNMGNAIQAGSMAHLVRMLVGQRYGFETAGLHMKQLSPYVCYDEEVDKEQGACPVVEGLLHTERSSLCAVNAFGFGGTVACAVSSGFVDKVSQPRETPAIHVYFWPGGGGKLEDEAVPKQGYDIVGSWSSWERNEPMEEESPGVFGYTVTIGEGHKEQFKIILDGDSSKCLHTGYWEAQSGWPVYGPDASTDFTWLIDTRRWAEGAESQQQQPDEGAVPVGGGAGDQYRVKLQVSGKWRTVVWEKLDKLPV